MGLSQLVIRLARRAFDGLVFDGMKLSDALKGVADTMVNTIYNLAMKPVQNALGGAVAEGLAGSDAAICGWLNADEQVDESIRANEYEFTANGSRY